MNTPTKTRAGIRRSMWLAMMVVFVLLFLTEFAFPYLLWKPHKMEAWAGEEGWIFLHVGMGAIALLTGPIQFWLGWRSKFISHKKVGKLYVIAVGVSGLISFYLAFINQTSWMYGLGLAGAGIAWWLTTAMAIWAIRGHHKLLHSEWKILLHSQWMTRSYIVTMSFVFFRVVTAITSYFDIGTPTERLEVASWFSWAFPLLIGEVLIQRKTLFY